MSTTVLQLTRYRKKKKDKSSRLTAEHKEELRKLVDDSVGEGSSHKSDRGTPGATDDDGKTEAERRFEEIQRRRVRWVWFLNAFYRGIY